MPAVEESPVRFDIEDAASLADQLRFDSGGVFDRFRQTDGLRLVVSLRAVGDGDLHDGPSAWHKSEELSNG